MKRLFILLLLLFAKLTAHSQSTLTIKEATKHIGDSVTILDKVYEAKVLEAGSIVFQLGENKNLTAVIPSGIRNKFTNNPEKTLLGKNVIVTGKLTGNKKALRITINDPKQLTEVIITDPAPNAKPIEIE